METSTRKDFHCLMREEARRLLAHIKNETDYNRRYQLCGLLLEIYEELDIEVRDNASFWGDIRLNYHHFVNHYS
ncbi:MULTISPECIES: hypothetical protein [Aneurinibacillus]|uniref:Uncharacterized protein n=1 Tax=Aneurinibacillus thermoaerophilus TaxID=143495 RepID=A0A1G7YYG1_ANETH|nr:MULTISPECIES: hypothetical protein [Aneurinibacillus]AMA73165.1 hypothetical protein ACH33_10045 [Aneurinibacillus sp. XH2]MED0674414.1 hypothetical protein [Aneurinibacillus thermoaerophilus]MED0678431.1 hypothetical protein [Aneurinibacillus thermoaerophilus]MED0736045.1 hypothetical protein [Aneurinibacillus thermoaerophilus]MED0758961.1 hypothetical protein [Aneurinibacillus thermoaerophilus]